MENTFLELNLLALAPSYSGLAICYQLRSLPLTSTPCVVTEMHSQVEARCTLRPPLPVTGLLAAVGLLEA